MVGTVGGLNFNSNFDNIFNIFKVSKKNFGVNFSMIRYTYIQSVDSSFEKNSELYSKIAIPHSIVRNRMVGTVGMFNFDNFFHILKVTIKKFGVKFSMIRHTYIQSINSSFGKNSELYFKIAIPRSIVRNHRVGTVNVLNFNNFLYKVMITGKNSWVKKTTVVYIYYQGKVSIFGKIANLDQKINSSILWHTVVCVRNFHNFNNDFHKFQN